MMMLINYLLTFQIEIEFTDCFLYIFILMHAIFISEFQRQQLQSRLANERWTTKNNQQLTQKHLFLLFTFLQTKPEEFQYSHERAHRIIHFKILPGEAQYSHSSQSKGSGSGKNTKLRKFCVALYPRVRFGIRSKHKTQKNLCGSALYPQSHPYSRTITGTLVGGTYTTT